MAWKTPKKSPGFSTRCKLYRHWEFPVHYGACADGRRQPLQPSSKKWTAQMRAGWHCPLRAYSTPRVLQLRLSQGSNAKSGTRYLRRARRIKLPRSSCPRALPILGSGWRTN
eukprot:5000549-Amphidinium_carterae.1